VFLAGHSVAMVTYCVTKMIPTCFWRQSLFFLYTKGVPEVVEFRWLDVDWPEKEFFWPINEEV